MSKVDRGAELEADRLWTINQPIAHVNGILAVGQQDSLFERDPLDFVTPDRQSALQSKLLKMLDAVQIQLARPLVAPQQKGPTARQTHQLRKMIEHYLPAERGGQRGHQQAVVAPRSDAG